MAHFTEEFNCQTCKIVEKSSLKIEWKIEKEIVYKLFEEDIGSRESSRFNSSFKDSAWVLELNHKSGNDPDALDIFLVLKKASVDYSKLLVKFNIILKANESSGYKDYVSKEDKWQNNIQDGRGFKHWITKKTLDKNHHWFDNFLIIVCEIQMKIMKEELTTTNNLPFEPTPVETLESSYLRLLNSGSFSDVTIKVGSKSFKAHRNILATRSEYFDAMLKNGLKESTSPVIELKDVESKVFEAMLLFIYTNQSATDIKTIAKDLLIASDKYLLKGLAEICEHHLCQMININNCVELLAYAENLNRAQLKKSVILFIKENIKHVLECDFWKTLMLNYPELALEALKFSV